jgi:branched-chain amino acid transport system substrate-binding protein
MDLKLKILCVLAALTAVGCSLSRFVYTPCQINSECRTAFGWGYVCAESLCQPVSAFSRCNKTLPANLLQQVESYQDRIVIGTQFDQSAFGTEALAAQFALGEVMRESGLDAESFAIVSCTTEESSEYDDLGVDEANIMVSTYLADHVGVAAIIGPATSDRVEDAFLNVKPFGTLLMSPTATSPSLSPLDGSTSDYEDPGLLWRTAPPDDIQGAELAELVDNDGATRVAVVVQNGSYGTGLGVIFKAAFEAGGGSATLLSYEPSAQSSLLDKIASAEDMVVDGVVFISSDKGHIGDFLQVVADRVAGVGHTCSNPTSCVFADDFAGIYLADGAKDADIFRGVEGLDTISHRIKGTAPAPAFGPVYEVFKDRFNAVYGTGKAESTAFTAYAYDAAWLVIYGAAWAHYNELEVNGLGIGRGLRNISDPGGQNIDVGPTSWNSVRAEFELAQPINVRGASGDLDYDPTTGETSSPIDHWCVETFEGFIVFGLVDGFDCASAD